MHLFFTNLHRRHSIRPNEIFKIHNTLCNPLTHTIPKLKSFSIRLKSLEANIKSHRQKIFQPPLPVPPFFLLQKNYPFPSHPKQYPISSSFNPQIYFHKFPPWRKTISFLVELEFPPPGPPKKKISCTRSSPNRGFRRNHPRSNDTR